jgi:hypothetical protein
MRISGQVNSEYRRFNHKKTPATDSGGGGCDFDLRSESRLEQDLQT